MERNIGTPPAGQRIENREWRMENGEWRMENGDWRLEIGQKVTVDREPSLGPRLLSALYRLLCLPEELALA
jgi:hypothetical protein